MRTENLLSKNFGSLLFICIMLSFSPILISTLLISDFRDSNTFSISVGLMFLLQSLLLIIFFIRKKGELVFHKNLLLFSWLFLVSQSITVLLSVYNGIIINNFDYINVFARFIAITIFFCIPTIFSLPKSGIKQFMSLIVIFGLIACIYNFFINLKDIFNIFNITDTNSVNLSSFFSNRNSFAQYLFVCIIANTYLFVNKGSKLYMFFYIIFGLNMLATFSRTGTVSTIIFLVLFYLFYYRHKISFIFIAILSMFILFLLVLFNPVFSNFIENYSRLESGTSGRWIIWEFGIQVVNNTSWLFGTGYLTGVNFLEQVGLPGQFHNFFIETLVGGGIIDLLLHLIIFIFVIKRVFLIYRYDKSTGLIYFTSFLALFAYSLFESVSFFSMGYVDSLFRIFFITIPLLYSNNFREIIKTEANYEI